MRNGTIGSAGVYIITYIEFETQELNEETA